MTEVLVSRRREGVEFGQVLLRLRPDRDPRTAAPLVEPVDSTPFPADEIPEGTFRLESPTDGIFYRRADPRSPPYVEEGSIVGRGDTMALVEVMKCFNPIVYPGEPDFPPRSRVRGILTGDGTEVRHGEPLFLLEPMSQGVGS